MRVSLNAWPKAPRDTINSLYLVLGIRDRGMKLERTQSGLNSRSDIREGLNPTHNLDGQKSNRVMPTSECQVILLVQRPFSADWGK